jgi:hypothetical protein
MSVLHELIDEFKVAAGKLAQHLVDLGHEAEDDLTALLHQAEAAAVPVIETAKADAEHLAAEAVADLAEAIPTSGTAAPAPDDATAA